MYAVNLPYIAVKDISDLPSDTCLISINDFEDWPLKVSGPNVKCVNFPDITGPVNRDGKVWEPISLHQALDLLDYIEKNKDKNFITQCHAGVSRSSALSLFIHLIYGHQLKDEFWELSMPNGYALGILMREYTRKKYLSE